MSVSRVSVALSLLAPVLLPGLSACGGEAASADVGVDVGSPSEDVGTDAAAPTPFELASAAYEDGAMIPLRHECAPPLVADGPGENISPALAWTAGPAATQSYAIVMRDRSAGDLVHWVLYDIGPDERQILEGVRPGYAPASPMGAHQAEIQGSSYFGYFGPCSPGSVNTYEITLHALETPTLLGVDRTTSEDDIAAAVEAASIASASLEGQS